MYTLYGAEVSYFTGKARAFLDWKRADYKEVVASREVYASVILPRVGWPVVPVVACPDGETLQDTSDIIDTLDARLGGSSVFPDGAVQKLAALLFELVGDEWLVLPAMHYRWIYNRDFAYAEFGRLSAPDASPEEQFETGKANAVRFEGSLPFLGITSETGPAIEAAYLRFLAHFSAHLGQHAMLFGDRPSIGDFGLYGPLYAHLYRDPVSGEVMKAKAPLVARWVERMQTPAPLSGSFLPGDEVPGTLIPILADLLADFIPVLVSTAAAVSGWAADKVSGDPVPRALGPHPFRIGALAGTRMIFPFNLWMLQRPLDHYRSLAGPDRTAADAFLSAIGALGVFQSIDFPRLERRSFKLVLA